MKAIELGNTMKCLFILSVFAMGILQIILNLKCRKKIYKLIPLMLSIVIISTLLISGMFCDNAWTGASLWIVGVFSILYPVACGIGWGISCLFKKPTDTAKN